MAFSRTNEAANAGSSSFLPEDYVAQAAERRTTLASLVLFGVVMSAVFGAFLVTNRQWTQVRQEQIRIHGETEKAAVDIRKMQELEKSRQQMVDKAELAMTLIEPVPRSTLLALVVNSMPERLSLLEFDLKSEEIKKPKKSDKDKPADGKPAAASAPKVAGRGKTKAEAEAAKGTEKEEPKVEPTRFLIGINMTGVAPTDLDVSRFMNALAAIPVFRGVRLEATEEKEIDGMTLRQFRIAMRIDTDADIRALKGSVPRPADPMSDEMQIAPQPITRTNPPVAPPATPTAADAVVGATPATEENRP
jgi:Tfp pilus assembly protein PilN